MLRVSNAYDRDVLREYHYRFFKCSKNHWCRTLYSFFLVKGEWYIKKFWLINLYSILDHGNICGIEISQCFYLVIASQEFNAIANITKKKASTILFMLGKDMHLVFVTLLYFRICFWVKATKDWCKNSYCSGCSCD